MGAGRKKGSVGLLSTEVREQLVQRNFNPLDRLIDICEDERTDIRIRVKVLMELCQYYCPKFKPIDISDLPADPIQVHVMGYCK